MPLDLQPGDILLTRSPGTVGALIRFGERVRYCGWAAALLWAARKTVGMAQPDRPEDPWYVNHAAVVVSPTECIEALANGLTRSPLTKYASAQTVTVRLADVAPTAGDWARARIVSFADEQLRRHDRYGWLSIASIILQLTTPFRLDISWDGALICSAFAAQALEHAGVVLPTRSSLTTMPADLRALAAHSPASPTIEGVAA